MFCEMGLRSSTGFSFNTLSNLVARRPGLTIVLSKHAECRHFKAPAHNHFKMVG